MHDPSSSKGGGKKIHEIDIVKFQETLGGACCRFLLSVSLFLVIGEKETEDDMLSDRLLASSTFGDMVLNSDRYFQATLFAPFYCKGGSYETY